MLTIRTYFYVIADSIFLLLRPGAHEPTGYTVVMLCVCVCYQYICFPGEVQVLVHASICMCTITYLLGFIISQIFEMKLCSRVIEKFDYLEALAGDQDSSSKGKPAHSGLIYNLTVKFILQQMLAMIVERDKTETKTMKL